jgi:Cu-Zn family superoxide dismutase
MKTLAFAAVVPALMLLPACAADEGAPASAGSTAAAPGARAMLAASDGTPKGEATISEAPGGLRVVVKAMGVTPGVHAVHIHTTGVCTAPDFASAGGHWNPTKHQHGADNPMGKHMGDMPNMTVGDDGTGMIDYLVPQGMLTGGDMPLLDADGAAVVIHAVADDNKSDPAGNAGGRIACGVVTAG